MNIIKKEKDELRERYIAERRAMDPTLKLERDAAICRAAVGLVSFRYAQYVLLYAATDDEINISGIAEAAWRAGKSVAYPRCDKATHTMKYHIVTSEDELSPDSYGIREPSPDSPIYDPEAESGSAVCFVPGLLYEGTAFASATEKVFTTDTSHRSRDVRSVWYTAITFFRPYRAEDTMWLLIFC